jgi:ABC-type branched-subunit amino acid transport system ATPase component
MHILRDALPALLSTDSLVSGYGKKKVLNGVSIAVSAGEVVSLIGHNGAGKSTMLKTVFGLLPAWSGGVSLEGTKLVRPEPRKMLCAGVAYVPQGNRVFTNMTVGENLRMGTSTVSDKARSAEAISRVLELFPGLKPRIDQNAGTLSGGEKQTVALAIALLLSPRLLLLDEPSLGLAPSKVTHALDYVRQLSARAGVGVLIVEQKVREVLKISDRVYVLRNGRVSFSGAASELHDERKLREAYL